MAVSEGKIRQAATLHYSGKTFREIAETIGKTAGTIHRWSKTDIWREEVERLQSVDRQHLEDQYMGNLKAHRRRLEQAASASIQLASKTLLTATKLLEQIDLSDVPPDRRIHAFSCLAKSYEQLINSGKNLFVEMSGLESVLSQLEFTGVIGHANQN
jgi:hypothetical protein